MFHKAAVGLEALAGRTVAAAAAAAVVRVVVLGVVALSVAVVAATHVLAPLVAPVGVPVNPVQSLQSATHVWSALQKNARSPLSMPAGVAPVKSAPAKQSAAVASTHVPPALASAGGAS